MVQVMGATDKFDATVVTRGEIAVMPAVDVSRDDDVYLIVGNGTGTKDGMFTNVAGSGATAAVQITGAKWTTTTTTASAKPGKISLGIGANTMNKVTVTLDQDIEGTNYLAGSQISYNDGLYTPDDGYAFYISQFAQVESKIYEAKYANITYAELIPVDTSYPEWADSWDYISYDGVTMGKFIGASAKDLPQVGLQANKTSVPIGYAGNSFGYSLDELRKSQQTRIPLDTTKGRLAFRGAQEHTQEVAYFGDASRGMAGLFNNPNLALDSSTIDYSTASGQEMVNDLNGILNKVWMKSANIHVPNVLVIPASIYTILTETRMDSGTDTTVLQFFMKNNLFFNQVVKLELYLVYSWKRINLLQTV